MNDNKMTEKTEFHLPVYIDRQSSFGKYFRIMAGTAAIVAVASYVNILHANMSMYYVSGITFAFSTIFSGFIGYLVFRCFFRRFTSLLAGVATAGVLSSQFLWRKGDDMREFAILGMLVAFSSFIAIGWCDRIREPLLKRGFWSRKADKGRKKEKGKRCAGPANFESGKGDITDIGKLEKDN